MSSPQKSIPPQSTRRFRSLRRLIVLYLLVPYFTVTLIFFIFQRTLMYRPTIAESLKVGRLGLDPAGLRDVEIRTADSETLNGWLLKHVGGDDDRKAPLLLYFPGNSLNRFERIHDLREVAACGFDVLIFDYRGFGDSSGSPSEQRLTRDARQIWMYARDEINYPEDQIVLFGESLGGAVALSLWSGELSPPPKPAALLLNSTFASMSQTVGWRYPLFPFRFLLLDRWPSMERVSRVHSPMTVFHGTADSMIPIEHARQLAAASVVPAQFVEIVGAEHNELPMDRLRTTLKELRANIRPNDIISDDGP